MSLYRSLSLSTWSIAWGGILLAIASLVLQFLSRTDLAHLLYDAIGLVPVAQAHPLPLWIWLLVGVIEVLGGVRLMDYYQLQDKSQAMLSIVGAISLSYVFSWGASPLWLLAMPTMLLGLVAQVSSYHNVSCPGHYFIQGLAIGVLSLIQPSLIHLLWILGIAQYVLGSLSLKHIVATLLGLGIFGVYLLPILYYMEGLPGVLSASEQWCSSAIDFHYAFSAGVSPLRDIPYLVLLTVGAGLALGVRYGVHQEGVFERDRAMLYTVWLVPLLLLSLFTRGASSFYTSMAVLPMMLLISRLLIYIPRRMQGRVLLILGVLLLLLLLFPLS